MNASDYEIDFSSGLYTCCMSHVEMCEEEVDRGSILECDECGQRMILQVDTKGKLMWRLLK